MKLNIFKQVEIHLPRKQLQALFENITSDEAGPGAVSQINLVLTGERQMRDLNRRFRDMDQATDVLSFQLDESLQADDVFGEIYVSFPAASRQAKEYGVTVNTELLRLVCHGLLHLFGYVHKEETDAQRMREREEHYLDCIGEL